MPVFPCMSSSSSSSSTPAPVKATAGSSSTASTSASWAVIKSDGDEEMMTMVNNKTVVGVLLPSVTLSSTASMEITEQPPANIDQDEGMDVMENLSYIDQLLDSNDFFDPPSIFQSSVPEDHHHHQLYDHDQEQSHRSKIQGGIQTDQSTTEPIYKSESDDLASMFLEWLKMNKDSIWADDLRKVKIKKSTIKCAARRLGGGREGMKQLLKLILEWVQNNHLLQKRRLKLRSINTAPMNPNPYPNTVTNLIPPTTTSNLNNCQPPCWVPPPPAYLTG